MSGGLRTARRRLATGQSDKCRSRNETGSGVDVHTFDDMHVGYRHAKCRNALALRLVARPNRTTHPERGLARLKCEDENCDEIRQYTRSPEEAHDEALAFGGSIMATVESAQVRKGGPG